MFFLNGFSLKGTLQFTNLTQTTYLGIRLVLEGTLKVYLDDETVYSNNINFEIYIRQEQSPKTFWDFSFSELNLGNDETILIKKGFKIVLENAKATVSDTNISSSSQAYANIITNVTSNGKYLDVY